MFHFLTRLGLSVLLLFVSCRLFSQSVPDSISYQAIVRDANGAELANQFVTIEFAIRGDSVNGTIYYEEFHDLIPTNQFGLFSAFIGGGVNTGNGLFELLGELPWASISFFLEVRATLPGSGQTQLLGTSQLLTVPYSFYSDRSGTAQLAYEVLNEGDGDSTNEVITGYYLDFPNLIIQEGDSEFPVDLTDLGITANSNEINDVHIEQDTLLVITESGNMPESYDVSELAYATWTKAGTSLHNNSAQVGINSVNPQSTLEINGSLSLQLEIINAPGSYSLGTDLNANATVYNADVTDGNVLIYLPLASTCYGRVYKFKKRDDNSSGNNLSLISAVGEMEGDDDFTLGAALYMEFATLISNGVMWYVVDYSFIYEP